MLLQFDGVHGDEDEGGIRGGEGGGDFANSIYGQPEFQYYSY